MGQRCPADSARQQEIGVKKQVDLGSKMLVPHKFCLISEKTKKLPYMTRKKISKICLVTIYFLELACSVKIALWRFCLDRMNNRA